MTRFACQGGAMRVEGVAIADIAAAVGTPLYIYSSAALDDAYRAFADAFATLPATICFALKANGNLAVVRHLAALGAGADVVSVGELRRALAAGMGADRIVYSGVGKTRDDIGVALDGGILQINVESLAELEVVGAVARTRGVRAPVALRVNPDVDAETCDKITTGRREDKFGIAFERVAEAAARAAAHDHLDLIGLAVHIGSQITGLAPFEAAYARLADMVRRLRGDGHAVPRLDLGGGLGIAYRDETPPAVADYAGLVARTVGGLGCRLLIEPGRALVGDAGVLVTRVLYIKDTGARRIVIVDGAMNDLMRPALYDAYHAIEPVREPLGDAVLAPADVVGPVCETTDTFGRDRPLPPLAEGDLLAIRSAGAYGAVMASTYNARPLVPEVLVRGGRFAVVRRRPGFDEMLALESLPEWDDDAAARPRRGVA